MPSVPLLSLSNDVGFFGALFTLTCFSSTDGAGLRKSTSWKPFIHS